jgi:regulator of sirC expression with transglutaminase-like and TPR domain
LKAVDLSHAAHVIYVEKGENAEAVKQLELYLKVSPASKEAEQIKNLIKELNKKTGRE